MKEDFLKYQQDITKELLYMVDTVTYIHIHIYIHSQNHYLHNSD